MKEADPKLHVLELRNAFSGHKSVKKADLRNFYRQHAQILAEQAFRRILYALEKQHIITPIGAGVYALHGTLPPQFPEKKKFAPALSQELEELNKVIHESFPYIYYLSWETRVLREFMTHQPGQNQIIIETEKDVCESVFNRLSQKYPGRIFLDPDRVTMERYVLHQAEGIIISRLISQSPKKKANGVPFPRLEKILVDIFADEQKFFIFQGEELVRIYENAFAAYWISEKTLFRYAGRRKVSAKLREFIRKQTQVELTHLQENAE